MGKLLLFEHYEDFGKLWFHDPYAISVVHGGKEPSRVVRTLASLKYLNNVIFHILPTLMEWHQ